MKDERIKLGKSTLSDLAKIELAFILEAKYPELSFIEINKLVQSQLSEPKRKINIVKRNDSYFNF